MPTLPTQPKFLFVTSIGVGKKSHANLPLIQKPLYSWMLGIPHADKAATERVIFYSAGKEWVDPEPSPELMNLSGQTGDDWLKREGLPAPGELKEWFIVRPAVLTDGECEGDKDAKKKEGKKPTRTKEPYRVVEEDAGAGYTISRRDVAHFLVERVATDWDSWQGKVAGISY
jgi:hypothetical protein